MPDLLEHMRRTHSCCELGVEDIGKEVVLMGWVLRRRDHGGVIFVDLRDRKGLTQVVFNPAVDRAVHAKAHGIRNEFVLAVRGKVDPRPEGMVNPNLEMYKVLGSADMPHIEPVLWTKNQDGVRSLGEPPTIPTAGAIACAVYNAIGTPIRHLPLTPDKVLAALAVKR